MCYDESIKIVIKINENDEEYIPILQKYKKLIDDEINNIKERIQENKYRLSEKKVKKTKEQLLEEIKDEILFLKQSQNDILEEIKEAEEKIEILNSIPDEEVVKEDKVKCDICKVRYQVNKYASHIKSKTHQKCLEI